MCNSGGEEANANMENNCISAVYERPRDQTEAVGG